jgi:quercetin dioxygenase-like cupin family protein
MIERQPKPDWASLPRPGCSNVEFRVLLAKDQFAMANLRFSEFATIDRHDAPFTIDVMCMSGSGFTSVGDETFVIRAGETVRWPKGEQHCLWTDGAPMEVITAEWHGS